MDKIEMNESIRCKGKTCKIDYYSRENSFNGKKYFARITLKGKDQVILDYDSLLELRMVANILCPLLVESRSIF